MDGLVVFDGLLNCGCIAYGVLQIMDGLVVYGLMRLIDGLVVSGYGIASCICYVVMLFMLFLLLCSWKV